MPPPKKIKAGNAGEHFGHGIGPSFPIHLRGQLSSRNWRIHKPQCWGAQPCWKIMSGGNSSSWGSTYCSSVSRNYCFGKLSVQKRRTGRSFYDVVANPFLTCYWSTRSPFIGDASIFMELVKEILDKFFLWRFFPYIFLSFRWIEIAALVSW